MALDSRQLSLMRMFREMTGVLSMDAIIDDGHKRLIFLVSRGDLGRAVGKRGRRMELMRKVVWRDLGFGVEVVEYSKDPRAFIHNLLNPARVSKVELVDQEGEVVAIAKVPEEDLGIAIGKEGRRIKRARVLAKRWFNVENVKIASQR